MRGSTNVFLGPKTSTIQVSAYLLTYSYWTSSSTGILVALHEGLSRIYLSWVGFCHYRVGPLIIRLYLAR